MIFNTKISLQHGFKLCQDIVVSTVCGLLRGISKLCQSTCLIHLPYDDTK